MARIPGYTVDGEQQYAPEYYDESGKFLLAPASKLPMGVLAGGGTVKPAYDPFAPGQNGDYKEPAKKKGPSTLGRILLALGEGAQGFADAASVPNVAAGGGTDLMRGLSYALNNQRQRRTEQQKMALQHEANLASAEQKRAMAEWYSARPGIETKKVENAAGVADDKSKQGWRRLDILGKTADSNAGYRTGMLGVAQQNANTNSSYKGTMGDVAKTNAVTGFNKLAVPFGMKTAGTYDDLKNGVRLIPEEYQDRSPVVNANVENKDANTGLTNAKTAETNKRTALMDRAMQIRATLAHAAMLGAQSSAQRAQIAKDVYNFEYKGEDEQGRPVLLDESGQPVAPKVVEATTKGEKIPAAMQTKVAQAHTIVGTGTDLIEMVNQLAKEGKIGPLMGRAQNAKGSYGLQDPDVKATVTELKNLASLLPAVHGQRGVTAKKDFEETIGGIEQKPESIVAAIQQIQKMSQRIISDNQKVYHPAGGRARAAGGGEGGQTAAYTVISPDGKEKKVMQLTKAQADWYKSQQAQVTPNAQ